MRKLLCFAALCAFLLPFACSFESAARAQKGKAGGATIEISEGRDGKFRFTVRNSDGKFLANSGANAFPSEKEALKGAEEFKSVVGSAKISVSKGKPKKAKGK